MSVRHCSRHPPAATVGGHCPACLLEAALAPSAPAERAICGSFTIQVPLGESPASSVFLVRDASATPRLLRLKHWHAPAPAGFLDAFERLKAHLEEWRPPAIVLPITAWVDAAGCPSVVTGFRQGVPLLESVSSGRLHRERAIRGLRQLHDVLEAAHERGLAHGSVVPGNAFAAPLDGEPFLLDFGLAPLLSGPGVPSGWAGADREGLGRIQALLDELGSGGPDAP